MFTLQLLFVRCKNRLTNHSALLTSIVIISMINTVGHFQSSLIRYQVQTSAPRISFCVWTLDKKSEYKTGSGRESTNYPFTNGSLLPCNNLTYQRIKLDSKLFQSLLQVTIYNNILQTYRIYCILHSCAQMRLCIP